jgi:RecA/RadA recombinase
VPGTKAMIVAGESGKGKSFICDVFLGQQIRNGGTGIKIEVEDAGGLDFTAKIIGDLEIAKKIQVISPSADKKGDVKPITIEKLTSILNNLINYQLSKPEDKRKQILLVIDSVSQLTSEKEYEDIQKDADKRDMTPQQKLRALFRNLMQQFRLSKITIVGIAHMTANIGVMFGPKTVINAKGSGFGYASSLNLMIVSNKEIEDSKTGIPVGVKMRIRTDKNRFEYKGRECWLHFNFGKGIDRYSGLSEILVQYGIASSSAKLSVIGELGDSNTMKWVDDSGNEHQWKVKETSSFIKSWKGGEENLLQIWENQLNQKLIEITGGDVIVASEEDYEVPDLVEISE